MPRLCPAALAAATLWVLAPMPASAQTNASPPLSGSGAQDATARAADLLYEGWRGRALLGQLVRAKGGSGAVGTVQDLIIDADGRAAAIVVQGSGPKQAFYRIPWSGIDLTPGRDGIGVDLSRDIVRYGLFPGSESVPTLPREFRLSELLGDYARLQTGYGYGIVSEAILTADGRLGAVLVTRDAASGGGTHAFPFPGTAGPWDPGLSYYGLPFVTEDQARMAGIPVDPGRVRNSML